MIIDEAVYLEHHGVKGQKWGVRKDRGHEGHSARTREIAKADKHFAKSVKTSSAYINIHNAAAEATNKHDIDRINNKPEYKNADFRKSSALRTKYYNEHRRAFLDQVHKAAEAMGTNASGTKKYGIFEDEHGGWYVTLDDVKHAETRRDFLFKVTVTYDNMGHIVKINPPEEIKHFGVKGMHWGQRKERRELAEKNLTPQQRRAKKQQKEFVKNVAVNTAVVTAGTAVYSLHQMSIHDPDRLARGAATVGKYAGTTMNAVKKAAKGAKLLFGKDGAIKYFPPGTYSPGNFADAGPLGLNAARKALGVGG